ncbi:MAG TPA: hypothetical protein PL009_07840 [Flavipsychrobacter sp.]|nr:hypothetical protein [Flavipsychrobacter sp.]
MTKDQPLVMVGSPQLVRHGLNMEIQKSDRFFVYDEYDDVPTLLEFANDLPTDTIVVLVASHGSNVERDVSHLRAARPAWRLLVVGESSDLQNIATVCIKTGGYLHYNEFRELNQTLQEILRKGRVANHWVHDSLLYVSEQRAALPDPELCERLKLLSETEKLVAQAICRGGGEIFKTTAASIDMNPATFDRHCEHIYKKLNVGNKTELILLMKKCGVG